MAQDNTTRRTSKEAGDTIRRLPNSLRSEHNITQTQEQTKYFLDADPSAEMVGTTCLLWPSRPVNCRNLVLDLLMCLSRSVDLLLKVGIISNFRVILNLKWKLRVQSIKLYHTQHRYPRRSIVGFECIRRYRRTLMCP